MGLPRTLLLTRPQDQSEAFARALAQRLPGRFLAIISPVLRIVPTPGAIDLSGSQGLAFTSANGVERFAARSPERALPAFCVGPLTADAASRAGFRAFSAEGDVDALTALIAREHRPGMGDLIHVRGRHAAGDLVARLRAAGVPARSAEIYDQMPTPIGGEALRMLAAGRMAALAFFSPRSAALFAAAARAAAWDLRAAAAVSLSAATDAALDTDAPSRRIVAATPTRDGMIAALAAL